MIWQTASTVILSLDAVFYTRPGLHGLRAGAGHFRLAVKIAFGFLALIWLIYLVQWGLDLGPEPFGIRPRQLDGLPGIAFAPLVHGSFAHLIANSPPLLVLGTAMLFLYPNSALRVLPAVYLGTGIVVPDQQAGSAARTASSGHGLA